MEHAARDQNASRAANCVDCQPVCPVIRSKSQSPRSRYVPIPPRESAAHFERNCSRGMRRGLVNGGGMSGDRNGGSEFHRHDAHPASTTPESRQLASRRASTMTKCLMFRAARQSALTAGSHAHRLFASDAVDDDSLDGRSPCRRETPTVPPVEQRLEGNGRAAERFNCDNEKFISQWSRTPRSEAGSTAPTARRRGPKTQSG